MSYKSKNISSSDANSTVVVRTAGLAGELGLVTINTTSAHVLAIYEGVDSTGTLLASLKASVAEGTYKYKIGVSKGICVVVPSGYTGNATISFI